MTPVDQAQPMPPREEPRRDSPPYTGLAPCPGPRGRRRDGRLRRCCSAAVAGIAPAQQAAPGAVAQRITPSFKDADITQVIEAVGAATGKNIIIDPRVRAQVTMLSSTPMSPDAFYEAFLALLQVHGFVAVPSGNVIKIVPGRQCPPGAGQRPARPRQRRLRRDRHPGRSRCRTSARRSWCRSCGR